jgi:hypothetical protein
MIFHNEQPLQTLYIKKDLQAECLGRPPRATREVRTVAPPQLPSNPSSTWPLPEAGRQEPVRAAKESGGEAFARKVSGGPHGEELSGQAVAAQRSTTGLQTRCRGGARVFFPDISVGGAPLASTLVVRSHWQGARVLDPPPLGADLVL